MVVLCFSRRQLYFLLFLKTFHLSIHLLQNSTSLRWAAKLLQKQEVQLPSAKAHKSAYCILVQTKQPTNLWSAWKQGAHLHVNPSEVRLRSGCKRTMTCYTALSIYVATATECSLSRRFTFSSVPVHSSHVQSSFLDSSLPRLLILDSVLWKAC